MKCLQKRLLIGRERTATGGQDKTEKQDAEHKRSKPRPARRFKRIARLCGRMGGDAMFQPANAGVMGREKVPLYVSTCRTHVLVRSQGKRPRGTDRSKILPEKEKTHAESDLPHRRRFRRHDERLGLYSRHLYDVMCPRWFSSLKQSRRAAPDRR